MYTERTTVDPHYIAFDMIDGGTSTTAADDILNQGEMIIDKNEKQKGYPSLQGLEA
jgi:hypothetical protein